VFGKDTKLLEGVHLLRAGKGTDCVEDEIRRSLRFFTALGPAFVPTI
jgi:hypothetical protein